MEWNKDNIIGKTICVSITYMNLVGEVQNTIQNCGKVLSANEETITYNILKNANSLSSQIKDFEGNEREANKGTERPTNTDTFSIPAFYKNIEAAEKDLVYMLDADGKPIEIDLLATFTVVPENSEDLDNLEQMEARF